MLYLDFFFFILFVFLIYMARTAVKKDEEKVW